MDRVKTSPGLAHSGIMLFPREICASFVIAICNQSVIAVLGRLTVVRNLYGICTGFMVPLAIICDEPTKNGNLREICMKSVIFAEGPSGPCSAAMDRDRLIQ